VPSTRRYLIVLAVLAVGYGLSWPIGRHALAPPRWPTDDGVFAVAGWSMGPLRVVEMQHTDEASQAIIQRTYLRDSGLEARLVVWTVPQPQAKTLFRKGPDRDFLGAGFISDPAPAGLPAAGERGALIVQRGPRASLLLYVHGERRGLLGSGPLAWGLAEMDALLDSPNDYFLARIDVPLQNGQLPPTSETIELADTVFAHLAAWYAS
jgi:hypothetical protein